MRNFSSNLIVAFSQDIEKAAKEFTQNTVIQNGLKLCYCSGIIGNGGLQSLYESMDPLVPFAEIPTLLDGFQSFDNADVIKKANLLLLKPGELIVDSKLWRNKRVLTRLDQLQSEFDWRAMNFIMLDLAVELFSFLPTVRRLFDSVQQHRSNAETPGGG